MGRIGERIRRQIELVEEQTGNLDPRESFRLIFLQTELERWKFLVRGFLRARVAKVRVYGQDCVLFDFSTMSTKLFVL